MRGWFLFSYIFLSFAWAGPESVALTALSYLERQYAFGSSDLYRMDCSAFVQRVFAVHGIKLPRTTQEQAQVGSEVSLAEIKPGDLLFFTTYKKGPSHVGIYLGNGKMVHASEKGGITVSGINEPYWRERFLFAKRVLKERDEIAELILSLKER